jgi:hypothetical protein
MQNSFPKNVEDFAQQASSYKASGGKTIFESNGEYGEVCKCTGMNCFT